MLHFLYQTLFTYEFFGYLSVCLNIASLMQKDIKKMLNFYILTGASYAFYIYIAKMDLSVLYVSYIGLFLSISSRILVDYPREKRILLQLSPLFSFFVLYLLGLDKISILTSIGFLLSTFAKLQNSLFLMRVFFIISFSVWLVIMIILNCPSFILLYLISILILLYQIIKDRKKRTIDFT
jgi:hypothetical protein